MAQYKVYLKGRDVPLIVNAGYWKMFNKRVYFWAENAEEEDKLAVFMAPEENLMAIQREG